MKTKLDEVQPFRLKNWIQSEEIRARILDGVKQDNLDSVCNSIFEYVDLLEELDRNCAWHEIAGLFSALAAKNLPKPIPLILGESKAISIPWDYDNHSWFYWLHTFAKTYGWTEEYIAELDFNDAIPLMQEIEVDNQLKLEWDWSLSEIAYPYNETTKAREFKPMKRPDWMVINTSNSAEKQIQKVKIPKDMIPVGNVISYGKFKS